MAIATRVDSFVPATLTHQSLYDGIKLGFTNAGFSNIVDQYIAGTDKIIVYGIVLDSAKTFGTTYLRVRVTSTLVIATAIYTAWNATAHTGSNASNEVAYPALVSSAPINFVALNGGDEFKFAVLWSGAVTLFLGFIAPANRPAWWDLNTWNYCFFPTDSTLTLLYSSLLNPYNTQTTHTSLNNVYMGLSNLQTNRRDVLPGVIFYNASNRGIAGRTSDDLIMVAASGASRFDTIQIPGDTKEYLLLSNVSGGLAVRTI